MNKIIIAAFLVLASCADKEVRDIVLDNPDTDTNTSCTVGNGTITCPDGTKFTEREEIGANIYSIIYPCGDEANNQEILFRLSTGQIIAVFDSDNTNNLQQTRLTVLRPGSYVTTDQSNNNKRCNFKVLKDNEGVLVVSPGKEVVL